MRAELVDSEAGAFAILSWPVRSHALPEQLTSAERDVLRLAIAGASNREIATARGTSPRTVANQVAALFRKVGVRSRAELVAVSTRGRR